MDKLRASLNVPKEIVSDELLSDKEIRKRLRKTLQKACRIVRDYARTHHWHRDRTMRLRRSIKYKTKETSNSLEGTVYQDERQAPHGKFQLNGTGIYGEKGEVIDLNKNGRFKGYYWARRRRWVKFPLIRGIKRRDFIRNAYRKNKNLIQDMFREEVENIVGGKK
ncbi:MAG: HK97-gp10 family putative phage morphogenesis protein [Veillonella parvula]